MRILLINKYHRVHAGSERLYFDTAKLLIAQGHEVAYFAMRHKKNIPTPWSQYFVDEVDYEESKKTTLWQKVCMAQNILFNFAAKKRLEKLILDFKPDVAHLFNIYHQLSPSIIFALKKYHVPMVMTLCDYKLASPNYSLFVRGKIWNHSSSWRCIFDRCVKDSYPKSIICAVEKWLHSFLGSFGNVNIYIGLSRFAIQKFKELGFPYTIQYLPQPLLPVYRKASQETNEGTFLYFGRLSPEKGVATILYAFAKLSGKEKLTIVGFGPEEENLKQLARELNIENKISFLGPQYGETMQEILLSSKAVILASEWYENTPYVLLETLAAGKVIIASNIGGLSEWIKDGENGFLYEAGNADALAQKIRTLATLDTSSVQKNAQLSVNHLLGDKYIEKVQSIYKKLVSPPLTK